MEVAKKPWSMLGITLVAMAIPFTANANIMWPIQRGNDHVGMYSVIAISFFVEWPFLHTVSRQSWVRSLAITIGLNFFSAIAGIPFIPFSNFLTHRLVWPLEFFLFQRQYSWVGVLLLFGIAIFLNGYIKFWILKYALKFDFSTNSRRKIFIMSTLSVSVCYWRLLLGFPWAPVSK